jgi:hypothetical protein
MPPVMLEALDSEVDTFGNRCLSAQPGSAWDANSAQGECSSTTSPSHEIRKAFGLCIAAPDCILFVVCCELLHEPIEPRESRKRPKGCLARGSIPPFIVSISASENMAACTARVIGADGEHSMSRLRRKSRLSRRWYTFDCGAGRAIRHRPGNGVPRARAQAAGITD